MEYSRDDRFLISIGDYRECSVVVWFTRDYTVLTSSSLASPIHAFSWDPFVANEFTTIGRDKSVMFWILEENLGKFTLKVW